MKIKTCYKKTFERLLLLKKGVVLHATTVGTETRVATSCNSA